MVQENCVKNKVVIICGATASGKSDLAIQIAKSLNTEVISADSMYIYKGLNIGTAKPDELEMQGVKHHMIDIVDANENFTVSDYKKQAEPIISNLHKQGKIPIICGGTGFYINSLLYDLSYGNGKENLIAREKYKALAAEKGNDFVFDILKNVDPESAKKLHPNDLKRVIRALEIYENGSKKSEIVDELIPKYDYFAYCIDYEREILYERINKRVELMFNLGLISEVKNLLKNGITSKNQCMQAIGYKEILDFIDGKISEEQAKESIKLNTRHYAKRQITFFKKLPNLQKLNPNDTDNIKKIIKDLKND